MDYMVLVVICTTTGVVCRYMPHAADICPTTQRCQYTRRCYHVVKRPIADGATPHSPPRCTVQHERAATPTAARPAYVCVHTLPVAGLPTFRFFRGSPSASRLPALAYAGVRMPASTCDVSFGAASFPTSRHRSPCGILVQLMISSGRPASTPTPAHTYLPHPCYLPCYLVVHYSANTLLPQNSGLSQSKRIFPLLPRWHSPFMARIACSHSHFTCHCLLPAEHIPGDCLYLHAHTTAVPTYAFCLFLHTRLRTLCHSVLHTTTCSSGVFRL